MTIDGARFDTLLADLDRALSELSALIERDPPLWSRGKPGRWTAGQHVEHLTLCMAETADRLEQRLPALRAGTLEPPQRRGLLQRTWVGLVVGRGWLPRGGKTPQRFEASTQPDRAATLARIRREVGRHRAPGAGLTPAERDRLWTPNPFLPAWYYTLPEVVRMTAVHVRHHSKQIAELAARRPGPR